MCVYVYVYVSVYVYVYAYAHSHVYACMHACMDGRTDVNSQNSPAWPGMAPASEEARSWIPAAPGRLRAFAHIRLRSFFLGN